MLLDRCRLTGWIASAVHGFILCFLCQIPLAHALTLLERATVTVTIANEATARAPAETSLPYKWDSAVAGLSGTAHFTIKLPADRNGPPQALFVRRIGNAFELAVNGEMLASAGQFGDANFDSSTQPRLIVIPPRLLRDDNVLSITIGAVSGRNAGIGLVYAGSLEEMSALHKQALRWRNGAYLIILVISVTLGALALLLWLRQRESLYLYYALSELLWAVHISDIQFEAAPLPWPWWGIVSYSCYAIAPGFICKFSLAMVGKHQGWLKRVLDFQIWFSIPVIALALLAPYPGILSFWLGLTILLCTIVAAIVIRRGLRTSAIEIRALAVAVAITSGAAIRDFYVFRILHGYGGFPLLGLAWATFGMTLAWILVERLHKSTQSVANMNQHLAQQLAQREEELGALFASQAALGRSQAVMEERQRIMRDMHDGIGSQLVSAVHLAADPAVSRNILRDQLQDALDSLKLTVDAMQDTDGDIAMLLGALRYRLSPRFAAIGVTLGWDVQPLPPVHGWTIQKSRHLQMILFEAMSNVITHAQATHAHLSARHSNDEHGENIVISLSDNGVGLQENPSPEASGQGLANIRARAASIGAALRIRSSGEGTQVDLTIPVQAVDR